MNIHRSKMNKPQCFGIDERRYIPVTDFAAQSNRSTHRKGREKHKAQKHKSLCIEKIIRPGTRMTRIKRIYTDPCVSVSSAQSVFYRTPPIIDHDKKPQMKAPRVTPLEGVYTYALRGIRGCRVENPHGFGIDERRFVAINHRKVREERKAEEQKSSRLLRSLRLIEFHGIPTAQGNKEKIIFQTGATGSTGW
jgi:hypothetical protein